MTRPISIPCLLVIAAAFHLSSPSHAQSTSAEQKAALDAIKANFPYVLEGDNPQSLPQAGTYAACINGEQPVVLFDTGSSSATKTESNTWDATLVGKLVVYNCRKAALPGAVEQWRSIDNRNIAYMGSLEQQKGNFVNGYPEIKIHDSVISSIKHVEAFQATLKLTPQQGLPAAKVSTENVIALSNGKDVYVGKAKDNNTWVYGKPLPKEILLP